MHWCNTWPHTIMVSVILKDGKIYYWKVGQNSLKQKYFIDLSKCEYKEKEFIVLNDDEHDEVFTKLSIDWMRQWDIHPDFKGRSPFKESNLERGDILQCSLGSMKIIRNGKEVQFT